MDVRKRLYFLSLAVIAALANNLLHESVHYLAARSLGVGVREFRFLTNGWLTSQVVYAVPVEDRAGYHWLAIAWLPSVVTVAVGYLIYANRKRLLTKRPWLNALIWFTGVFFLLIDPAYLGLISLVIPGTDLAAVAAVGWSPWPPRLVALAVLALNSLLVFNWRREASARPHLYLA